MPRLFHIEVQGARDVRGRFARATAEIARAQREEMRELGRRIVQVMRAEAPRRTGRLVKGIRVETEAERPKEVSLAVRSDAPYTVYVVRGRGPVFPIRAKALRFEPGPPGSGFIFRKRVGPAKPNPFPSRAFRRLAQFDEPARTAGRISARVLRAYSYR